MPSRYLADNQLECLVTIITMVELTLMPQVVSLTQQ